MKEKKKKNPISENLLGGKKRTGIVKKKVRFMGNSSIFLYFRGPRGGRKNNNKTETRTQTKNDATSVV